MIIVGISAFYHDSACAVLVDGQLVAAAQEERFTRRRHEKAIPVRAFRACLRQAGLSISEVDRLAYYEDPVVRLGRQLWTHAPVPPPMEASELDRIDPQRPFREIRFVLGFDGPIDVISHHESHAASAFYCSGFPEAAVLTADAVGEWATTSYGHGEAAGLTLSEEVWFPHSLGLLYSVMTSYLGFAVNSDEYKVMGLAAFGEPRLRETCDSLLELLPGGQFRLDGRFFDFSATDRMYTDSLEELLGFPPRAPDAPVETCHADLAASVQEKLEEALLSVAGHLYDLTGSDRLAYAGGVALNCVANSRLRREGPFRQIFIQPAAGDAGGSIGAAAAAHHRCTGTAPAARMTHAFLGPSYGDAQIRRCVEAAGLPFVDFADDLPGLLDMTAELLASGAVVGWCQGRMEFGPRALGARSILADPRDPAMRDHINALVKKREPFRPFAPAVVVERCAEFFELTEPTPYMLDTAMVRDGEALGAVTHVDGSARVQTVDVSTAPRFHGLLTAFGRRTSYPVLLNTSFNIRGEPIVHSPASALTAFVRCGLDALVIDDVLVRGEDVPRTWRDMISMIGSAPPAISRDLYTFL